MINYHKLEQGVSKHFLLLQILPWKMCYLMLSRWFILDCIIMIIIIILQRMSTDHFLTNHISLPDNYTCSHIVFLHGLSLFSVMWWVILSWYHISHWSFSYCKKTIASIVTFFPQALNSYCKKTIELIYCHLGLLLSCQGDKSHLSCKFQLLLENNRINLLIAILACCYLVKGIYHTSPANFSYC